MLFPFFPVPPAFVLPALTEGLTEQSLSQVPTDPNPAAEPLPGFTTNPPTTPPPRLRPLRPLRPNLAPNLPPALEPEISQPQEIRPLPGRLDSVPVFNSNNPEIVSGEGILLSTLPPEGMVNAEAHLGYAFEGRFDIFTHHISRAATPEQVRTMFQGVVLYNPSDRPVTVQVLNGATYLTRPDALFLPLESYLEDSRGSVFSGPGSRVVNEVLRGNRQGVLPESIVIPPRSPQLLLNLPIPVGPLTPSSNTRSLLMRLQSDGKVYAANVALYAPRDEQGNERAPSLEDYWTTLQTGSLVKPNDAIPTPPRSVFFVSRLIYGRVAGVAEGSVWRTTVTDPNSDKLTIAGPGRAIAYPISTLPRGTLGTEQVQSAPMLARYPFSAYLSHGNYGVEYDLTFPLFNGSDRSQAVAVVFHTPVKTDDGGILRFLREPPDRVFYRGTVRLQFENDRGREETRFVHIVQKRGQLGEPLIILNLKPQEMRKVRATLLYPADATPPQVFSIYTLDPVSAGQLQPVIRDRDLRRF
ncbi:DUF3370 domain-containing protein [Synechococcus elongatus]|uniref:DUF3370 domain-containing protein n=1 Tax=Synechococcus elongatus PCC 11801 TaxID=2219813 RepID=A0AAQ3MEI0_SYNEL